MVIFMVKNLPEKSVLKMAHSGLKMGKNIAIQLQMCNGCIIFDLLDYAGIFLFLEVKKITKSFEKILGKIIKPLYCTFFEILV